MVGRGEGRKEGEGKEGRTDRGRKEGGKEGEGGRGEREEMNMI